MDKERTRKIMRDKKNSHGAVYKNWNNIFINRMRLLLKFEILRTLCASKFCREVGRWVSRHTGTAAGLGSHTNTRILYQSHC